MTITTIDRTAEYTERRIAWLSAHVARRATDRREYVHHCVASFDGALAVGKGCGQTINTAMADDFVAHCPNCSRHDDDYRVFRYYGDPDEYERADRQTRDWVGICIGLAFVCLGAALLMLVFV